jgi:predicted Zn-dependent protease with MMP-like domain
MSTRREIFDDLVLDSADRIQPALARARAEIEFAVEEVPPGDPAPWEDDVAPLARVFRGNASMPHRIVVYRRGIESRTANERELAALIHEVVVEQVSVLLDVPPEEIDPTGP